MAMNSGQGARAASDPQEAAQAKALAPDEAFFVAHDTEYRYSTQVAFAQHLAHLTPMDAPGQTLVDFDLEIEPPPSIRHERKDYFGSVRTYFALNSAHEVLLVRARSKVRVAARFGGVDPALSPAWEDVRDGLQYVAGRTFQPQSEFTFPSAYVQKDAALAAYAAESFNAGRPLLAGALELMHRIHEDFRYDAKSTDVGTSALEAFEKKAGVCQDFAHIMIGCLRSIGIPARYVSGYLFTQARFAQFDAVRRAAPVVGADASHAWVAVHCPKYGWVEFDPTNDAIPGTGHVRLASARDYGDVSPLRGVVQGGGEHELQVAVRVTAAD
jgi:transglutaminase-like putative cysteine protease